VHHWDSAVGQAKAAIAGQAAAVWPGTGLPGEVATVAQSTNMPNLGSIKVQTANTGGDSKPATDKSSPPAEKDTHRVLRRREALMRLSMSQVPLPYMTPKQ
jgi:hypothetical protein